MTVLCSTATQGVCCDCFVRASFSQFTHTAMLSNCKIQRIAVISNDHVKEWVPKIEVVEHDGAEMEFFKVGKWDRQFVRFCTGKALDLRGATKHNINSGFMDQLSLDFVKACNDAVQAALIVSAVVDEPSKKKPKTVAKPTDYMLTTPYVDVEVPPQKSGDITIDPKVLKMKFDPPKAGKGRRQNLWIELTVQNLEYLRAAILSCGESDSSVTPRKWGSKQSDVTLDSADGDDQSSGDSGDDGSGEDESNEEAEEDNEEAEEEVKALTAQTQKQTIDGSDDEEDNEEAEAKEDN